MARIRAAFYRQCLFCAVALVVAGIFGSAGQAQAVLDPYLVPFLEGPVAGPANIGIPKLERLRKGQPAFFPLLVRFEGSLSSVKAAGFHPVAVRNGVATGYATRAVLRKLRELPQVIFVEAAHLLWPVNDVATVETGARAAQRDSNLTGKGVLIGLVDTGIDWTHADFRNPDGSTRILYLLDFSDPGDVDGDGDLDGAGPYGGTLYTREAIQAALEGRGQVAEEDRVGHGTHVAGTAVGNGRGTGAPYPDHAFAGVAPEADIVVVKATRTEGSGILDTDQIHAIAFIDSIATVLGEPYVVNISLGGHNGPHDGTTLVEQFIDGMFGSGVRGKALVAAAGNDGDDPIHASGSFSPTKRSYEIRMRIESYDPKDGARNDYVSVEVWYPGTVSLSFTVKSPSGKQVGPVRTGQKDYGDTSDGLIWVDNASQGRDPRNGDRSVLFQVYDYHADRPPKSGVWTLTLQGSSGHFDLWTASASMDVELLDYLDPSIKVGVPGSARHVITVGSYITKKEWTDLDGHRLTGSTVRSRQLGDYSIFSSPGPTRDGRVKPEICAPGEEIASSLSHSALPGTPYSMFDTHSEAYPNGFILQDRQHAISQGTSMAAPHVAGTVALLFQRHPDLDALQARSLLIGSARTDAFTGDVPNAQWGYGKLSVLGVLALRVPEPNPGPTDFSLHPPYPNPFSVQTKIVIGELGPEPASTPPVHVVIYDVLGRQVRTLFEGRWLTGRPLYWDGTNDAGQPVGAGVYFIRVKLGNTSRLYKVVRLGEGKRK